MNNQEGDESNRDPKEQPRPIEIDLDKLRRHRICKKRYGQATLTILRWGGLGLLGDQRLGRTLRDFRAGEASAEDAAWAFVRSRVEATLRPSASGMPSSND